MSTITTLLVPGMTCGHCVASVTKEVEAVAGVDHVSVELRKGEDSEVTVFSHNPLGADLLTEAIDEAGYEITSMTVTENAVAADSQEQAESQEAAN